MTGTGSNHPYSRPRSRADLVAALPAIGMLLGAAGGVLLGLVNPEGSVVGFAGVGIGAGLVLGIVLRLAFRRG